MNTGKYLVPTSLKIGFTINYFDDFLQWSTKKFQSWTQTSYLTTDINDILCFPNEDNMLNQENLKNYVTWILDSKFEQVDEAKLTASQKHSTLSQCHVLNNML